MGDHCVTDQDNSLGGGLIGVFPHWHLEHDDNEIRGRKDKNNGGIDKNTKLAVKSSGRQDRTLAVGSSPDQSTYIGVDL